MWQTKLFLQEIKIKLIDNISFIFLYYVYNASFKVTRKIVMTDSKEANTYFQDKSSSLPRKKVQRSDFPINSTNIY